MRSIIYTLLILITAITISFAGYGDTGWGTLGFGEAPWGSGESTVSSADSLLLESGDYLLLESGDKLLLE